MSSPHTLYTPSISKIKIQKYYSDVRVVAEAEEVASSVRARGRSAKEKLQDCSNGLALQYAVFDDLVTRGFDVTPSPVKEYDIIVKIKGAPVHIDVKGIFKPNAKTYSQTEWESISVHALKHKVFYLCFDCRSGEAIYDGWTDESSFTPSIYYSGTFIYASALNK